MVWKDSTLDRRRTITEMCEQASKLLCSEFLMILQNFFGGSKRQDEEAILNSVVERVTNDDSLES